MNKSDSIAKLAGALAKVQGELRPAAKNAKNPFFKSEYADLESIVEAARKPMADNGLSVSQFPGELIPKDGGGFMATMTTIIMHESGEWIEHTTMIPLAKIDPQGYGSAITYARRYSLAPALGIVTGDDDDGNAASQVKRNGDARGATSPQSQAERERPTITPPKPTDTMKQAFHATGSDLYGDEWDDRRPVLVEAISAKRDDGQAVTSSNDLYRAEMQHLIDGMNEKLAERKAETEGDDE